jgi:hypothetical protein
MKTAASADGTLDASEGYIPKSIQRVFRTAHDLHQPDPITLAERAGGQRG